MIAPLTDGGRILSTDSSLLPAIVLAGDRAGGSPLARSHGVSAGVLVEVNGQSCLARVLETLRESAGIDGGLVVGPAREVLDANADLRAMLSGDFRWVEPAAGPSASAATALESLNRYPTLLTGGDHALLTAAIVDRFCRAALEKDVDFVVGLVPWRRVHETWPSSRRTVLRFADGACCGANLFLVRTSRGRAVLDFWRRMEMHRKHPWRLARRIGLLSLLRYFTGTLHLDTALTRLGARAGAKLGVVFIDDPRAAVDVDSDADLALAEEILQHG